tara:strand:+ start:70 stop:282 length:213 start_codon:yes stop_codon:yes gene_type:complete
MGKKLKRLRRQQLRASALDALIPEPIKEAPAPEPVAAPEPEPVVIPEPEMPKGKVIVSKPKAKKRAKKEE